MRTHEAGSWVLFSLLVVWGRAAAPRRLYSAAPCRPQNREIKKKNNGFQRCVERPRPPHDSLKINELIEVV